MDHIWYYTKSHKSYLIEIPDALSAKLGSMACVFNECGQHGPEKTRDGTYYFTCRLPRGHGGRFHLCANSDFVTAIWPTNQSEAGQEVLALAGTFLLMLLVVCGLLLLVNLLTALAGHPVDCFALLRAFFYWLFTPGV